MTARAVPSTVRLLAAAALFASASLAGCADRDDATRPDAKATASAGASDRRPIDAELVAFLSKVRSAHHSADLVEQRGDLALAVKHLEAIPYGPIPGKSPEIAEVLADVHARLADLKSRMGAFDPAVREIERGLTWATETTHFRGHLFEVRGVVEERRMLDLEKKGDLDGAEKARKAALAAFEEAIEIQDAVILSALSGTAAPPGSGSAPAPSADPD